MSNIENLPPKMWKKIMAAAVKIVEEKKGAFLRPIVQAAKIVEYGSRSLSPCIMWSHMIPGHFYIPTPYLLHFTLSGLFTGQLTCLHWLQVLVTFIYHLHNLSASLPYQFYYHTCFSVALIYYGLDYRHLSHVHTCHDDWGTFSLPYTHCPYKLIYYL